VINIAIYGTLSSSPLQLPLYFRRK